MINKGILKTKSRFGFNCELNSLDLDKIDLETKEILNLLNDENEPKELTKVKGIITKIENDEVFIDIGIKSEGKVKVSEFLTEKDLNNENLEDKLGIESLNPEDLKVGREVEVFLIKTEDKNGRPVLSRLEALKHEAYKILHKAFEDQKSIKGCIASFARSGGYVVSLLGCINAFLPGSQFEANVALNRDNNSCIGKYYDFRILKISPTGKFNDFNIIVSRKVILDELSRGDKLKAIEHIKPGMKVEGVVKSIVQYGAFVSFEAKYTDSENKEKSYVLDGFVHLGEISWDRIDSASDKLSVGEKREFLIENIDPNSFKIQLSLKKCLPSPWDEIESQYPVGSKVTATIKSANDSYASLSIGEKDSIKIQGILTQQEISWSRPVSPNKCYVIGQIIEALVIQIDKLEHKIFLSVKQLTQNPWQTFAQSHKVGDKIKVTVHSPREYGLFCSLTGSSGENLDIEGLIHVQDLTWGNDGEKILSSYMKGDVVECVILNIDVNKTEKQKVSLGIKQLTEDPYKDTYNKYKIGDEIEIEIKDREREVVGGVSKGEVLAGLTHEGIKALINRSEIGFASEAKRYDRFSKGEKVKAIITGVDRNENRIYVSIAEYEKNILKGQKVVNNNLDI